METLTKDSPKMEKKAEEFNPLSFEKKLTGLKDTQESIQSMSNWCLKQRTHHKKIVSSWLNVLKRVKVEQRLVLFYLANDVIQYSKRKGYEFVESWGLNLQKATPLVRDEKVRHKILRIFKIWEQRTVYDEEFLSDLTGLLSAGALKKSPDDDASDFQPQQLVNKIKQCAVLEGDTDMRLRFIHECHLQLSDADALCANLKERRNMDEVEKELGEGIERVERYTAALQREIVAREALLALLTSAHQYYGTQRGEVKVVAYAYKNFGARVRCLKRKLDDKIKKLPSRAERTPSPPRPDEEVPSPGPDEDLQLPNNEDGDTATYNIDKTFSTSMTADGSLYSAGFSSFLGAENPFNFFQDGTTADAGSKIEVISSAGSGSGSAEKPDFNINEFLKTLTSEPPPTDHTTAAPAQLKVSDTLPGLDLLTPESAGNASTGPPQLSFYGSLDNSVQDEPESYQSDPQWSNTPASWGATRSVGGSRLSTPPLVPPALTTPQAAAPPPAYADTPESPPPAPLHTPTATLIVPESRHYAQDMPPQDVDHRGLLPPPPPPPMLPSMPIVDLEDVDHRRLPPMTTSAPPLVPTRHQTPHKDVDHRNLIPLTSHPPPSNNRHHQGSIDQDYRVPPPMPPSDIVESVDMDLSDDEQQSEMYQNDRQHFNQQGFPNEDRRHFHKNNNKVLVGGDNGTRNHKPPPKDTSKDRHHNLIRINSVPNDPGDADIFESMEKIHATEPQSAPPVMKPMVNPFENQEYQAPSQPEIPPPVFQSFNDNRKLMEVDFDNIEEAMQLMDSRENSDEDNAYSEDLRTRFLPDQRETRNPSPPRADFLEEEWTRFDNDCANPPNRYPNFQQNQMSPRFQRNWNPMRPPFGFRPQGFGPQQFWPRNGPRPPPNRPPWPAQRPRGGFW